LAEAALAARDFDRARKTLAPLLEGRPSVSVCLLMADLAEVDETAHGSVREWLARASRAPRDAAWIADGVISDTWAPVSPVTGRLDAFTWGTPVEQIAVSERDTLRAERAAAAALPAADDVIADIDEPEALLDDGTDRTPSGPLIEAAAEPAPAAPAMPVDASAPGLAGPPDHSATPDQARPSENGHAQSRPDASASAQTVQAPAAQGSSARAPVSQAQAQAVQAVQAQAVQAPVVQAPAVQAPAAQSARPQHRETRALAQDDGDAVPQAIANPGPDPRRRSTQPTPVVFPLAAAPDDPGPDGLEQPTRGRMTFLQ